MSAVRMADGKTQREALADLCRRQRPARVVLLGHGPPQCIAETTFAALDDNYLDLHWPTHGLAADVIENAVVEVYFAYAGQRLAFRTQSAGRAFTAESLPVWRLHCPPSVEVRQQREHFRVSLADAECVLVTLSPWEGCAPVVEGQLNNISGGGLRATVSLLDRALLQEGERYYASFELPDDPGAFELGVRLVHADPVERAGTLVLGLQFCPGADRADFQNQLERIERFVRQHERMRLGRANRQELGGD